LPKCVFLEESWFAPEFRHQHGLQSEFA
jgi:hypothetical protein